MKLPVSLFISAIEERKIYYFSTTRINSQVPHHFVCIKRTDNELLVMVCCTSQFESRRRYIETRKLPNETLVWISPKETSNQFVKDTYVDCNNTFTFTIEEFKAKYNSDIIKHTGEISEVHYEQILIGIHKSPLIDSETKELIPKP